MPVVNAGEILVRALARQGARKIFSIPGGQILGVYESIRKNPDVELIVPRQEGAGALMACGYSLATGDPGVVISTVGAGVIYEIAGILYAWLERIPIISIAPQVQSWRIKPVQENLQAMDQDDLYAPLVKFHAIIYHLDRVGQLLERAYRIATAPEPGPVHLDLPVDIAFAEKRLSRSRLARMVRKSDETRFTGSVGADPAELEKAVSLIRDAKRPLALAGRLAARPGALGPLRNFLARARMPAVTSNPAFSALSTRKGLLLGTPDLYEDEVSRDLIRRSDLLFYIEPDTEIINFSQDILGDSISGHSIQLSSHPAMFQSFAQPQALLAGSAGLILEQLEGMIKDVDAHKRMEWLDELQDMKAHALIKSRAKVQENKLHALAQTFGAINRGLGEEDYVVCEGRDVVYAAKLYLENYSPGHAILVSESAPFGCGFPVALGIKAAKERSRVFLVSDRRNFKYHCREFQTASRYRLGVCSVVLPERIPLDEDEPELAALADSLGVKGISIYEPVEDITDEMISEAVELEAGALLEIRSF